MTRFQAVAMIKELETLRRAIGQMNAPLSPSPPRPPREATAPRSRPDAANRINHISKAPEFDVIQEGDSDGGEEQAGPDPRNVPLPEDDEEQRAATPPPPQENAVASSSTGTSRRKPTRRQSGLIGPVRTRPTSPPNEEPITQEEDEVDELLAGDDVRRVPSAGSKAPGKRPSSSVDESTKAKRKGKEPMTGNHKLKDVTNSPPRNDGSNTIRKGILSVLSENSGDGQSAAPF